MSTLVCGSLAYDTILTFPDRFDNYILSDQMHDLNVCFVSPEMRREFGGCAGNISYNLKLLGGEPLLMGTVGTDFQNYRDWLKQCEIPDTFVREIPGFYSAQCVITTDIENNQITSIHPGAMGESHQNRVAEATNTTIGIVAPDGRQGMIQHAADFSSLNTPFLFDPGQNLRLFNKNELLTFIEQASWLIMNNYESNLLLDIIGGTLEEHASSVDALIVTRGSQGSRIYHSGTVLQIPPVTVAQTLDPTGCGDAYRAGILHGLAKGWDWDRTGKVASLLGALNAEQHGTQNHRYGQAELDMRYEEAFGDSYPTW